MRFLFPASEGNHAVSQNAIPVTPEEPKPETPSQPPIPGHLPVVPVKEVVTFPYMIVPLSITRDRSVKAVDQALGENRMILLLAQRDATDEEPAPERLYQVGTVGLILRMLKMPDHSLRVLAQGISRARVRTFTSEAAFLAAEIEVLDEPEVETTLEVEATMRSVREGLEKVASLGREIPGEILLVANHQDKPGPLADLAASHLELATDKAQEVLELQDPVARLKRVNELMAHELELLAMQQKINAQAKEEIDKTQKEYFLRQQMKAIQSELGETGQMAAEIAALRKKADEAQIPAEARAELDEQIARLERMHPESAETAVIRTYIEWMIALPWSVSTEDRIDLSEAQQVLDEDHYDLEKVKTRILEYLAVLKLTHNTRGPILCFVGPPGVGKTSLGKSIARALGRKFVRLSLGGMHDEAEIRGHRRTYIGAMPGRIIQGLRTSGTNNPVFMLDEVDKVGVDFRGDPSSALLEVLDPEQNNVFRDNYLGVPFDLSKVMFVTTANMADPIQAALRDRMEMIHLAGYSEREKLLIARKYLIPRQTAANGITEQDIQFQDDAIRMIISHYTREAGLRNLEREIAAICRRVARRRAEGNTDSVTINPVEVRTALGPERIMPERLLREDKVGVALGLAWTPAGGDILFVEAITMKGKSQLFLTGHLGEVMQESAKAALSYARANSEKYGIDSEFFERRDIHVHVPAGAIPKDGPSAGVTLAVALISACAKRPVDHRIAMTGEITLRGQVTPVGGIKEKVLAAAQAGIREVLLPEGNQKDLEEIPKDVAAEMTFTPVEDIDQAVRRALR
jgi:ATP-dependent Lon protease